MNHHRTLLLLVSFLFSIKVNAGKDPKEPSTPGAPRTARLNPEQRRTKIEDGNPLRNPVTYAPQQQRLSRKERDRKINAILAMLKSGSRSPSPLRR